MGPKQISQFILKVMQDFNLYGHSEEEIFSRVSRELAFQGFKLSKKTFSSVMQYLYKSATLKVKLGKRGSASVYLNDKCFEGTYFGINNKLGKIIVKGTNDTHFVSKDKVGFVQDGDIVKFTINNSGNVSIISTKRSKSDLQSEKELIKGYIAKNENGRLEFVPDDKRKYPHNMIMLSKIDGSMEGKVVVAKLNQLDYLRESVYLESVFGAKDDPIAETNAIAVEAGVNLEEDPQILKEVENIPDQVDYSEISLCSENSFKATKSSKPLYVDLRDKWFCTVDPKDCRDMDDAVYTEIDKGGNFVTYTAIANVTNYIKPDSAIWNEAKNQAFTLYTPYDAFGMIPKKLSNGILSLNENEDRLTQCVRTVIDSHTGERISSNIMHAVINSHKKFSYEDAQEIFDKIDIDSIYRNILTRACQNNDGKPKDNVEAIALNRLCANKIWKKFNNRNMLNVNKDDERKFILSQNGKSVLGIEKRKQIPSMDMIEALMINANEAVAEYTKECNLPSIYRVHDSANTEKLDKLRQLMKIVGLPYYGDGSNISLQKFSEKYKNSDYLSLINDMILRTQSKAKYSSKPYPTDEKGNDKPLALCHSALQSPTYTHFTAGIRRVSDLYVQYALKQHLLGEKVPFSKEYLEQVSAKCSGQEIKIDNAERQIDSLYTAIWAEDHINDIVEARFVAFNNDKAILEEINTGVRLTLDIHDIAPFAHTDNSGVALYDKQGKVIKKLFDTIKVKIANADRTQRVVEVSTNLKRTFNKEQQEKDIN